MIYKLVVFAGISVLVYLAIATILIASQTPQVPAEAMAADKGLDFSSAIDTDYSTMPESSFFIARDNTQLAYRSYESIGATDRLIILVHGSGWHGMQYHGMAERLASAGVGEVIVPDLRGHGFAPQRRGDIDYIGQYEDDIADLIDHLQNQNGRSVDSKREIVLGGHSSGGGFVVRFMGGKYGSLVDLVVLLAPFLKYDAPTTRQNSGNWAFAATRRLIGLSMLNAVGITLFNHLPVIAFNLPKTVLDGALGSTATLQYSYVLNTSMAPRFNYEADLSKIGQPLLLVAGSNDEAFIAEQFEPLISRNVANGRYEIVGGVNHLGIVADVRTSRLMSEWLAERQECMWPRTSQHFHRCVSANTAVR